MLLGGRARTGKIELTLRKPGLRQRKKTRPMMARAHGNPSSTLLMMMKVLYLQYRPAKKQSLDYIRIFDPKRDGLQLGRPFKAPKSG